MFETKKQTEEPKEEQPKNGTATWVKTIGVLLIIGGIISGLIINGETTGFGLNENLKTYYRALSITVIVSGIVSGTLFIGIGEIIRLLFSIDSKNENLN